jgi:hypothetical protein
MLRLSRLWDTSGRTTGRTGSEARGAGRFGSEFVRRTADSEAVRRDGALGSSTSIESDWAGLTRGLETTLLVWRTGGPEPNEEG